VASDRIRHPFLPSSPVVLVTGASTGIGLALARRLRDWDDARVILTARDSSLGRLSEAGFVESERLWLRSLDVNDPEDRGRVVAEADSKLGGVDVLINNAGIAYRSVTEHTAPDEMLAQLTTNFVSPMDLARLVLPTMREKGRGRIINVSSVSGMMAMPTMGAYSASKFALEGATESLWYELKPWRIHVTFVQPGFVHSDSFRKVILSEQAEAAIAQREDPYHPTYAAMGPFVERLMNLALATPEDIANRILGTLEQGRPRLRVFATFDARFFYMLRRLLPRRLFHALLYRALPGVKGWGPPP
jgi:NAD(P)-dependent dehydrogenase (short-subunit alcohol dehydrogenase family)